MVLPEGVREDVPAARVGGARVSHVVRACARARADGIAWHFSGTSPRSDVPSRPRLLDHAPMSAPSGPRPLRDHLEQNRAAAAEAEPSLPFRTPWEAAGRAQDATGTPGSPSSRPESADAWRDCSAAEREAQGRDLGYILRNALPSSSLRSVADLPNRNVPRCSMGARRDRPKASRPNARASLPAEGSNIPEENPPSPQEGPQRGVRWHD